MAMDDGDGHVLYFWRLRFYFLLFIVIILIIMDYYCYFFPSAMAM